MQHILLLYLIVSILPGIAALTMLSAIASRFRNRGLTYYLVAYGCFSVSILINLIMFYLGINISKEISVEVYALIVIGIPFSILMHTMLPLAVNEVTRIPGKRLIDSGIIMVCIMELAVFCTPLVIRYSRESNSLVFGPLFPLSNVVELISIGYSIAVIVILRKNISNTTVRKYILTLILVMAVFLPAIGYDQFIFFGVKSIDLVPIEVILSPIFYMTLSMVTLVFGARILKAAAHLENSVNAPVGAINQLSLESKIHELAERTGLSEREITIIPLISNGLGNKQIALELHISSKTVGNHIYNIYRKLNISSRYELLALLK